MFISLSARTHCSAKHKTRRVRNDKLYRYLLHRRVTKAESIFFIENIITCTCELLMTRHRLMGGGLCGVKHPLRQKKKF